MFLIVLQWECLLHKSLIPGFPLARREQGKRGGDPKIDEI